MAQVEDTNKKKESVTGDLIHDRNIFSLFKQFGLSRGEIKCYLSSLTLGPASVAAIAKSARVNRANAYSAVRELGARGLVEQEVTSKGVRVHPSSLEQLQEFAQVYQKRATKLRWRVEDLIPELMKLGGNHLEKPHFLVYEGAQAVRTMIKRTLNISPGSEIQQMCLFPSNDDDVANAKYSREQYVPERLKLKISFRLICPKTPIYIDLAKRDHAELRQTRFLPRQYMSNDNLGSMHIYGDEIALYWRTPDPKGMTIKSSRIASIMRTLFNIAWDSAAGVKK